MCLYWSSRITGEPIEADAAQTLTMALNLRHHGVVSLDAAPPFAPSMYREPLPVMATAAAIAITDAAWGPAAPSEYLAGPRARAVKLQNLLWLVLLSVAALWATYRLTSSLPLGLLAAWLMNVDVVPLVSWGPEALLLDTLYSDLPAAALLLAGAACLAGAWRGGRLAGCVPAGLCFGLAALVKAAFLYVGIGLLAALACLALAERSRASVRHALLGVGVLGLVFAVVVLPWMMRNQAAFGRFELAERGGVVLWVRALKDGMTAEERRGALYAWAPARLQAPIGAALGFAPRDLERGGRLQRLNRGADSSFHEADVAAELAGRPEEAISYYRKGRAERVRLTRIAAGAGEPAPEVAADAALKAQALERIAEHPLRHLAMSLLFVWRGAPFACPVLVAALVFGLRRRDQALVAFAVPALGLVAFYALFSHFIPRYGLPAMPVAVVAGIVLAASATAVLRRPLRAARAALERHLAALPTSRSM